MPDFVLSAICMGGYYYAAVRWLKLKTTDALFFMIPLIGIVLYLFALAGVLETGRSFVIWGGYFLAAMALSGIPVLMVKHNGMPQATTLKGFQTAPLWLHRIVSIIYRWPVPFTVLGIFGLCFALAWNMKFTVTDDYVYWGIIGKYLFLNHHLPDDQTTIISRHLSYTPGTGLFHYFFYGFTGRYNTTLSYFAQNVLFMAPIVAVLRSEKFRFSFMQLCFVLMMMVLFCGSVLAKLQVDYLLSVYCFAVLWLYYQDPVISAGGIIRLAPAVCFLFLIKEVGGFLAFFCLTVICLDIIFHSGLENRKKVQLIGGVAFCSAGLFLIKRLWNTHCLKMGFLKFDSGINPESIMASFRIFSDEMVQNGFLLFAGDLTIGPADRLNLPYLLWFGIMAFCWVFLFRKHSLTDSMRYGRFLAAGLFFFFVYLAMIYFLQIIVFGVGRDYQETVGLNRYVNIFFLPMVLFTTVLYIKQRFADCVISGKKCMAWAVTALLLVAGSRVETSLRRETFFETAEDIALKIQSEIMIHPEMEIAVIPGNNDGFLGLQLLYHLLPVRVNDNPFPTRDVDSFLTVLKKKEYALITNAERLPTEWMVFATPERDVSPGFFKLEHQTSGTTLLTRLFEIRL